MIPYVHTYSHTQTKSTNPSLPTKRPVMDLPSIRHWGCWMRCSGVRICEDHSFDFVGKGRCLAAARRQRSTNRLMGSQTSDGMGFWLPVWVGKRCSCYSYGSWKKDTSSERDKHCVNVRLKLIFFWWILPCWFIWARRCTGCSGFGCLGFRHPICPSKVYEANYEGSVTCEGTSSWIAQQMLQQSQRGGCPEHPLTGWD